MSIIHTKYEYNIRTPLHLCTTYAACKLGRVNCKNLTFISIVKSRAYERFSRRVLRQKKRRWKHIVIYRDLYTHKIFITMILKMQYVLCFATVRTYETCVLHTNSVRMISKISHSVREIIIALRKMIKLDIIITNYLK